MRLYVGLFMLPLECKTRQVKKLPFLECDMPHLPQGSSLWILQYDPMRERWNTLYEPVSVTLSH